jgi:long-chain fatty acid transport protein
MKNTKRLLAIAVSTALSVPMMAHATNGMNLEAYGPIAGGMGGASMAYDNGTAAVMNNPATLGLMDDGNRVDVAIGNMRPDVTTDSQMAQMSWESSSDSFLMPAIGWAKKANGMTYGLGMFSQGGMGTEYAGTSSPGGVFSAGWMTNQSPMYGDGSNPMTYSPCDVVSAYAGTTCGTTDSQTAMGAAGMYTAAGTAMALPERSEVGVGRLIVPFTYDVNENLVVGGSVDYVWAGMDLQMAMNGMMMGDMMGPSSQFGSISGTMVDGFRSLMFHPADNPTGMIYGLNYGYFDFSNDNDFTGEATGAGFAGKIGATFKVNPQLTIGATYHSKTAMSDLEASGANVTMSVLASMDDGANFTEMSMPLVGDIKVKDFQWPETMALGMAYQANDKLMVVADVKQINWSDVMANFTMEFTASQAATNNFGPNMDMRGASMTAVMYQDWKDQTVAQLGASYMVTNETTLRAGYNYASNPVPDDKMNYLFPAITETHYTMGVGHAINDAQSIDFALSYVPKVTGGGANGFTTSMSQLNWQMMYSHGF